MAKSKSAKKKPTPKSKPAARKPAAKKPATPAARNPAARKPAAKAPAKKAPAKAGKKPARKVVIPPPIKSVAVPLVPIMHDEPAPAAKEAPDAAAAKPARTEPSRRLKASETAEIRDLLLKRREELLGEIRAELDKSKVAAQKRSADPTDQASDSADGDLALALAQSDSAELNQIDAALARSDSGELGVCDECGTTIPMERLRVLPHATTCTGCRRKLELQGDVDDLGEAWEAVSDSEDEQEGEEE